MIVIPAIDLQGGRVVQLVGGTPGTERVSLPDPIAVLDGWVGEGARTIHVVDLDAARGTGSNAPVVRRMLERAGPRCQVGGGIRSAEHVEALLDGSAARVVVGTRAIQDPAWLEETARRFPKRIVVALDARAGRVAINGWQAHSRDAPWDVARRVAALPLAGLLTTCIDVEGRLQGLDRGFVRRMLAASTLPLQVSGGVTDLDDVSFLARNGVHAAIVGLALYEGRFTLKEAHDKIQEVMA